MADFDSNNDSAGNTMMDWAGAADLTCCPYHSIELKPQRQMLVHTSPLKGKHTIDCHARHRGGRTPESSNVLSAAAKVDS